MQRLQREGGVAHPGVAVVPVALAPRSLGQRRRECRHRCAGGHVREALDRKRRTLDRVPIAVVRDPCPVEPGPPEARRGGDPRRGVVDVLRSRQPFGPAEGAVGPLSRLEHVPRPHAAAFDPQREVRLEAKGLARAARIGCVAVALDQRPLRRSPSVIEYGLADEVDLDPALEAFDSSYQHVVGVVVGRRPSVGRDRVLVLRGPHRQCVADDDPPGGRLPRRHEHVRPRLVAACGRIVDAERREAEEPCLAVEQAGEDARRIEARYAEPVDRPVRRHQRARVTVREERVVGDRRERRRRGRSACRVPRLAPRRS